MAKKPSTQPEAGTGLEPATINLEGWRGCEQGLLHPHLARLKSLKIPADVLQVGTIIRPMLLGVGAMLLVGGCSVTQFAAEQQSNIESWAKLGFWLTGHGPGAQPRRFGHRRSR